MVTKHCLNWNTSERQRWERTGGFLLCWLWPSPPWADYRARATQSLKRQRNQTLSQEMTAQTGKAESGISLLRLQTKVNKQFNVSHNVVSQVWLLKSSRGEKKKNFPQEKLETWNTMWHYSNMYIFKDEAPTPFFSHAFHFFSLWQHRFWGIKRSLTETPHWRAKTAECNAHVMSRYRVWWVWRAQTVFCNNTKDWRHYSVIMWEVTHKGHSLSERSHSIKESQGGIIVFEP